MQAVVFQSGCFLHQACAAVPRSIFFGSPQVTGEIPFLGQVMRNEERNIDPDMTVLDVVARFRGTEAVFRKYDDRAGECICCQALFEPLRQVAEKYHLDLDQLLKDLEAAA